jgi:hypothetical protein
VRETEAEAVAFIVATAIGIRSSLDATDYIQLYDRNSDTLRQSLHRIQATAKTILSALALETSAVAAHETTVSRPDGCAVINKQGARQVEHRLSDTLPVATRRL